jgi:hypothetical protein
MRLLKIHGEGRFSLEEFTGEDIPRYAILSHTWGPDKEEVSYQDMVNGTGRNKVGYGKILFCGNQAAKDGLVHFWVDTCCIDKSSSAELTESINSMYQWYKNAVVCYVTLMDLPAQVSVDEGFPQCRWFTRGWYVNSPYKDVRIPPLTSCHDCRTLQELIAPKDVRFYNQAWSFVGSKQNLAVILAQITGISGKYVREPVGSHPGSGPSVATRMSWASRRTTKRIEDQAYCLLGIFDVSMPLIYGEGIKAFIRLQEEIIKRNNDLTIFAWNNSPTSEESFISPLATLPAAFAGSHDIRQADHDFPEFSITNKGLLISGGFRLFLRVKQTSEGLQAHSYFIALGAVYDEGLIGVYLSKIGTNLYGRSTRFAMANVSSPQSGNDVSQFQEMRTHDVTEICILLNTTSALTMASSSRHRGIHIPPDSYFKLTTAIPRILWNGPERLYLRPPRNNWMEYDMVLIMRFVLRLDHGADTPLAVLCHHTTDGPQLKIFTRPQYPQEYELISQARYRREGIHVQELDLKARSVRAMTNSTTIQVLVSHQLKVSMIPYTTQTIVGPVFVSALSFEIDGKTTRSLSPQPSYK